MSAVKIYSLGENAVTIEFGNEISSEINERVAQLDRYFNENKFPGFIETVPAYASLSVFFDVPRVRSGFSAFSTAFEAVKNLTEIALNSSDNFDSPRARAIEIPICFSDEYALDLESISENVNLTKREIIEIFTNRIYKVYMLGFLPGFAYMGETDDRIASPRKENPRTTVPKGSVGIAGKQTGIYPLASPGGWQIVGRTDLEMFTPDAENPTLLRIGDSVKFVPVDKLGSSE